MSVREATAQQVDPLGVLAQRPVVIVLGAFAVVFAVVRTIMSPDPGTSLRLSVTAIALVIVAVGILVIASSPYRAPFTGRSLSLIVFCGVLAAIAEAASSAGHDLMVRDDWGSASIGLLILSCAPFRPARDLALATVAGGVVVACIVLAEAPAFPSASPTVVLVAMGVAPVIALGLGAAVYSATFVRLVEQWIAHATRLTSEGAEDLRSGIVRSVQQDRVTGLNQDVVPFFTQLVERGEVSEDDRERARRVAATIRARIVAESDRSWLEQLLLDASPRGRAGKVVDRAHLASRMSGDQRTAVRAVVNALAQDAGTDAANIGVVLHDDAPLVRALIRVDNRDSDSAVRQRFASYFAVLRIVFHDLQVDVSGSFLTLRFSYDQH